MMTLGSEEAALMMMFTASGFNPLTVAILGLTTLKLHLHRDVPNLVMMVQIVMNTLQQSIMIVRRDHLDMKSDYRFFSDQP